jgi:hypothetical protein
MLCALLCALLCSRRLRLSLRSHQRALHVDADPPPHVRPAAAAAVHKVGVCRLHQLLQQQEKGRYCCTQAGKQAGADAVVFFCVSAAACNRCRQLPSSPLFEDDAPILDNRAGCPLLLACTAIRLYFGSPLTKLMRFSAKAHFVR